MERIKLPEGLLTRPVSDPPDETKPTRVTRENACQICHEQNKTSEASGGLVFYFDSDGYRCCYECMERYMCTELPIHHEKAVRKVIARSEMPKELLTKEVAGFKPTLPWQGNMRKMAIEWCKNKYWRKHQKGNKDWLILCGQPGTGKTHLASACSNHMLKQGYELLYARWSEVMQGVRSHDMHFLERCKKAPVLFLDDLYKGDHFTPMEMKATAELIDHRYVNDLITIVTTEKDQNQLKDLDQATLGRIVERCNGSWYIIPKQKESDYRLRDFMQGNVHANG